MQINNVKYLMTFKETKEINEIIEEIQEIEKYQRNIDIANAERFLTKLSIKYAKYKVEYNILNTHIGKTLKENLRNAKNFLFYVADKIIVENTMGITNG